MKDPVSPLPLRCIFLFYQKNVVEEFHSLRDLYFPLSKREV
jgi:hypothetical protein